MASRARNVRVIVRGRGLSSSMSQYLIDRIEASPRIEVITETEVAAVHGAATVESVSLRDRAGSIRQVSATAVFVMIGAVPCTEAAVGMLALDPGGYLLCGCGAADSNGPLSWPLKDRPRHLLETVRPGVFAAGDVRAGALNRVEGASVGCFREWSWATRPAWPICADTAAPSAWTASVSRTRSGMSASANTRVWRLTRPPIDTAQ